MTSPLSLSDAKKEPKINGSATHGNRGHIEYLAEAEEKKTNAAAAAAGNNGNLKKQEQRQRNVFRQLWDAVWLRRSRRKVVNEAGHPNGVGVVWEDGNAASHGSASQLSDGFDYQALLDLDHNQKIELTFYGYRECPFKALLYYLTLIVTFGLVALVYHWNADWALYVRRKRCSLRDAQFMLIVEKYKHTEASQHDAMHSGAIQRELEKEHEVYFVETIHRVGVEEVKEQFLSERRTGVEKLAQAEPNSPHEQVKEKWFDRFLKRACLFEKAEYEVKPSKEERAKMSKSPDTITTLIMDDDTTTVGGETGQDAKKTEELKIHEHFLKFLHFSIHFDNGIFEGEWRWRNCLIVMSFIDFSLFLVLNELRFFRYKQLRYVWNEKECRFVKIMGLDNNIPNKLLQPQYGLSIAEQMSR